MIRPAVAVLRAEWETIRWNMADTPARAFTDRLLAALEAESPPTGRDDAIREMLERVGRPVHAELHDGTVLIPWEAYNRLLKAATGVRAGSQQTGTPERCQERSVDLESDEPCLHSLPCPHHNIWRKRAEEAERRFTELTEALEREHGGPQTGTAPSNVTRFEVIDHRHGAPEVGRAFVVWNAAIELSYQDAGRTLKVFVDDAITGVPDRELDDNEAAAEDATWD